MPDYRVRCFAANGRIDSVRIRDSLRTARGIYALACRSGCTRIELWQFDGSAWLLLNSHGQFCSSPHPAESYHWGQRPR